MPQTSFNSLGTKKKNDEHYFLGDIYGKGALSGKKARSDGKTQLSSLKKRSKVVIHYFGAV